MSRNQPFDLWFEHGNFALAANSVEFVPQACCGFSIMILTNME
jgi:hypothetical protein